MFANIISRDSFRDSYQVAIEKSTFDGRYNAASVIVTLSIALSLYNSLEMALLISMTFKRWRGLYFWSLVLCTLGVILYTFGMMTTYFRLGLLAVCKVVLDIGWVMMILCQSLVLYSRLGLILDNPSIINAVKWMIIVDSILLFPIVIIFDFGSTYSNNNSFSAGYFYIEHIQITGFTVQELIISGIYVWKTLALLKILQKKNTRNVIWQLLTMNIIIMAMDIMLIVFEYKHFQLYQEATKAFVYSVKLKLELNVLSKLIDLVSGNARTRSMTLDMIDSNTINGQTVSDVPRIMSVAGPFDEWLASDVKRSEKQKDIAQVEAATASSSSGPSDSNNKDDDTDDDHDDDIDRIRRTLSQRSGSVAFARNSGRESDLMYAEMLNSMK